MTYIGYEGTRTPGHLDLCSTIGHNIMLYANNNSGAVRACYPPVHGALYYRRRGTSLPGRTSRK